MIVPGILPCKKPEKWAKARETNLILAGIRYPKDEVIFLDPAMHFIQENGSLKKELYTDGDHLKFQGYKVMADAIAPNIERLVGLGPIRPKDRLLHSSADRPRGLRLECGRR